MILTTVLIPINLINRYHFDNGKSDSGMIYHIALPVYEGAHTKPPSKEGGNLLMGQSLLKAS